jgi:peptidyl-prolyl cis-trans isomerase D
VSEADVKAYYDKNKDKFTQEATRDIAYVVWDIVPSQEDKDAVAKWATDVKPEFTAAENAQQFVAANAESRFNEYYLSMIDVPMQIRSWSSEAKPGDVYGPWEDGLAWKLARITDVKDLPDSVKAAHILIAPVNNVDYDAAQKTADSIKGLIERGQDFATLAGQFGTDATKDKGGDLGWFTMQKMDPTFGKACFFAKKGELITVRTQWGIHVVKVEDQSAASKKVQIAILDRTVTPSDKTYQDVYNTASIFASTNDNGTKFEAGITKENLNKRIAANLKEGDAAITGLESPRELVRWAFTARKGELSELKEYGPRFVLAKLTEVREKGTAPIDQVRTEIENSVRNEKKAEYLIGQLNQAMQGVNSLEALAPKVNANVQQAANAYFTSYTITGLGMEPMVTAAFTSIPVNTLSKPIKGTNGVYVIQVTNVVEPDLAANRSESLTRLDQSYTSRAGYEVFGALEKKAKVVDRRNKFY